MAVRPFPLLSKGGVSSPVSPSAGSVASLVGGAETARKPSSNGLAALESGLPQLTPRCADPSSLRPLDCAKKAGKAGAGGQGSTGPPPTDALPERCVPRQPARGGPRGAPSRPTPFPSVVADGAASRAPAPAPSAPLSLGLSSTRSSPLKTPVSQAAATSAGPVPAPPPVGTEMSPLAPKSGPFAARVPVYPPHSDSLQYFQDPRAHLSYDAPQYPQAGEQSARGGWG